MRRVLLGSVAVLVFVVLVWRMWRESSSQGVVESPHEQPPTSRRDERWDLEGEATRRVSPPVVNDGGPSSDGGRAHRVAARTAREAIERRVEALQQSGPMEPGLRAVGERALQELVVGYQVEQSGCYASACLATVALSASEREALAKRVREPGAALSQWPGPRQQLEPITLPGGDRRVTWLLLPPQ